MVIKHVKSWKVLPTVGCEWVSENKYYKVLCIAYTAQSCWRMKTIQVSLLGNTNELQDLISDPQTYPAALYTLWWYDDYIWGIIWKTIKQTFIRYQL